MVDNISVPTARARVWRGMTEPRAQERTLAEHRAIYKAIMNRDADLARSRRCISPASSHGCALPWPTNTAPATSPSLRQSLLTWLQASCAASADASAVSQQHVDPSAQLAKVTHFGNRVAIAAVFTDP